MRPDPWRKQLPKVEQIIVTLQISRECQDIYEQITNLQIGPDELFAYGKSIQQLLHEMHEQGQEIVRSWASPQGQHMHIRYEFTRDNDTAAI